MNQRTQERTLSIKNSNGRRGQVLCVYVVILDVEICLQRCQNEVHLIEE